MAPGSGVSTKEAEPDCLRRALKSLSRFRREQAAAEQRSATHKVAWSTVLTTMAIALGFVSLVEWPYCDHSPAFASLGVLLLLAALAYRGIPWAFAVLQWVFRIPVVLFFEARMHLVELVLMVALLGHGVGMIIGHSCASDSADLLFGLCTLWAVIVLGGTAWGLRAALVLDEESSSRRCAMILIGILSPAAIVGLLVGPWYVIDNLFTLPARTPVDLVWFGSALLATSSSLYVLKQAFHYHSEVWRVLHAGTYRHRRAQLRAAQLAKMGLVSGAYMKAPDIQSHPWMRT